MSLELKHSLFLSPICSYLENNAGSLYHNKLGMAGENKPGVVQEGQCINVGRVAAAVAFCSFNWCLNKNSLPFVALMDNVHCRYFTPVVSLCPL